MLIIERFLLSPYAALRLLLVAFYIAILELLARNAKILGDT